MIKYEIRKQLRIVGAIAVLMASMRLLSVTTYAQTYSGVLHRNVSVAGIHEQDECSPNIYLTKDKDIYLMRDNKIYFDIADEGSGIRRILVTGGERAGECKKVLFEKNCLLPGIHQYGFGLSNQMCAQVLCVTVSVWDCCNNVSRSYLILHDMNRMGSERYTQILADKDHCFVPINPELRPCQYYFLYDEKRKRRRNFGKILMV